MAQAPAQDMKLIRLVNQFHSEEKCRAFLEEVRWPKGITCPRCGSNVSRIKTRGQFECNKCTYQFSITSGTIFHDSHLPLWKWLLTTYMVIEAKKGVSANQVKRMLGISYKTSWYLCHRIRAAMKEANPTLLTEDVEADETYVGGKRKGRGPGYKDNKTLILGVVQRNGNVRLQVGAGVDRTTLREFLSAHVSPKAKHILTDEWTGYKGIGDADTKHESVNHVQGEWVRGDVHTNTVEGVWSLLNRAIIGAYHKISAKHLDAYLDELEWRYNNRRNPYLFRETLKRLIIADRLPYKQLTGDA